MSTKKRGRKNVAPMLKCINQKYVCSADTKVVVAICTFAWNPPFRLSKILGTEPLVLTSRGIARCSDLDIYDEKFGRKIAFLKARDRALSRYCRAIQGLAKDLKGSLDDALDVESALHADKLAIDVLLKTSRSGSAENDD